MRIAALAAAALAVVAAALAVVASASAAAPLKTKTAERGPIRATVSWKAHGEIFATNVRIRISRGGRAVVDRKLGLALPQVLRIRDLNGDGEGEVVADFYTGGAHCCLFSRIYRYTGTTYTALRHMWGNGGYRLDGRNLVSVDDRFAYAFTAYAGSGFPIQIWRYRAGRLVDVTRSFPKLIRADAASHWKSYLRDRKRESPDPRGVLAAWMADQYLLGREAQGWKTMEQINARGELGGFGNGDTWAKGTAYLARLKRFLERTGYAKN